MDWQQNYNALIEFGRLHNHYNVPQKNYFKCELVDPTTGETSVYYGKLGKWLDNQRQAKKAGE